MRRQTRGALAREHVLRLAKAANLPETNLQLSTEDLTTLLKTRFGGDLDRLERRARRAATSNDIHNINKDPDNARNKRKRIMLEEEDEEAEEEEDEEEEDEEEEDDDDHERDGAAPSKRSKKKQKKSASKNKKKPREAPIASRTRFRQKTLTETFPVAEKMKRSTSSSSSSSSSCSSHHRNSNITTSTSENNSNSSNVPKVNRSTTTTSNKNKKRKNIIKLEAVVEEEEGEEVEETEIDPITMEPIKPAFRFLYVRPNGTKVAFNAVSLVDYMLCSGDFTDPLTRTPFTQSDLVRLDETVKQAGGTRESVYIASQNHGKYKSEKVNRDALLAMERCIGEQISNILDLIEAVNTRQVDGEDAEEHLLNILIPSIHHNFDILRSQDPVYAKQCLKQYTTFLQGPPNRETRNFLGFRDYCFSVLQMLGILHVQ